MQKIYIFLENDTNILTYSEFLIKN